MDTNPFDDPQPTTASNAAAQQAKLDELRRREQDLERREAELNNKAEHIRRHGRNNFPPCQFWFFIYSICIIYLSNISLVFPLIFHSIQDEIPEIHRPLITRIFQLWLVLFGTLVINLVACIIILIAGSPSGGSDLGASLGYANFFHSLVNNSYSALNLNNSAISFSFPSYHSSRGTG